MGSQDWKYWNDFLEYDFDKAKKRNYQFRKAKIEQQRQQEEKRLYCPILRKRQYSGCISSKYYQDLEDKKNDYKKRKQRFAMGPLDCHYDSCNNCWTPISKHSSYGRRVQYSSIIARKKYGLFRD